MYLCKILYDIQIYLCAESVFLSEFKPALLQKIGLYQIIRDGGSLAKRNKTNLSICLGSPPPVLDLLLLLPDHDSTVHNFLSQEFYTVSCQGFFWGLFRCWSISITDLFCFSLTSSWLTHLGPVTFATWVCITLTLFPHFIKNEEIN